MQYSNLTSTNNADGFLHVRLAGDYSKTACHRMLEELNEECKMHGYEAVMIDLGLLHGLSSVSDIWLELTSPKAIKILPFRVAWVYGGEAWDENWKHVEIALKAKSLKWRNFSDLDEAEKWLGLSRHEALAE